MVAERVDKTVHQARFLEAYANCADISLAAKWAQVRRGMHYYWLENDPGYPPRFQAALRKSVDVFRNEAVRRAVRGTNKPVFYKGRIVGHIQEFSDTLLLAYLKARAEEFKQVDDDEDRRRQALPQNTFREVILVALAPYPEARQQVAQKLLELEAAQETEAKP